MNPVQNQSGFFKWVDQSLDSHNYYGFYEVSSAAGSLNPGDNLRLAYVSGQGRMQSEQVETAAVPAARSWGKSTPAITGKARGRSNIKVLIQRLQGRLQLLRARAPGPLQSPVVLATAGFAVVVLIALFVGRIFF